MATYIDEASVWSVWIINLKKIKPLKVSMETQKSPIQEMKRCLIWRKRQKKSTQTDKLTYDWMWFLCQGDKK